VTAFSQFIFTHKNELSILFTVGAMPTVAVLWQGSSTKSELRKEITAVKSELKKEITAVKSELKEEITAVKSELKEEITGLEGRLMKEIRHIYPCSHYRFHAHSNHQSCQEADRFDQCLSSGAK